MSAPRLRRAALALAALAAAAAAADDTLVVRTPDFGVVNMTWTPAPADDVVAAARNTTAASCGGATLSLSFGASVLGTLPLGVGRTQLTLLSDVVPLPEVRAPPAAIEPKSASQKCRRCGVRRRSSSAPQGAAPPVAPHGPRRVGALISARRMR